ncbi:hypothetical protein [Pseudomonas poae]|uniref:hypothetical protein n=1 Tax=Pseudomonas poae TaxID=200451 RepID=UPI0030E365B0
MQALGVMIPVNVISTDEAHRAGVAGRQRHNVSRRREKMFMVRFETVSEGDIRGNRATPYRHGATVH